MNSSDSERFCYEKLPFMEVLPIYKVHRVHNERDGPVTGYAILYDMKTIAKYQFNQIFEFNKEVFKDAKQLRKGKNLLKIKNYLRKGEEIFFVVDPYSISLKNYIEDSNQTISEQKALNIIGQVLQAVFSIISSRFTCINLRPQHFVKVKEDWKLKSLVLNTSRRGFSSEFIWNPEFQPPEAYEKDDFTIEELDNTIVWNVGSLLIDLLAGKHVLKSYQIIKKFADSNYDLKSIGIKKQIHEQTQQFIKKSLAFDVKDRMLINVLFQWSFIKYRIKQSIKEEPDPIPLNLQESKDQMNNVYHSIITENAFQDQLSNRLSISTMNQNIPSVIPDQKFLIEQEEFKLIIKKYELEIDIATFLTSASEKISFELNEYYRGQVHKDSINKPFMNFISFSFMGLIVINNVKQSLVFFQNIYDFKSELWNKFTNSGIYSLLKMRVEQVYKKLETHYEIFLQMTKQHINENKLPKDFKDLMNKHHQKTTMNEIKDTYRKILTETLQIFNKSAQENIRNMTIVGYSLLFNKLHDSPGEERQNFLQFMKINNPQQQNSEFTMQKYKAFIYEGKKSIINKHFRFLNRKYFT